MRQRAFTLMEVIIYIALFSILMTGGIIATYQLIEGGTHNETAVGIQEEGTFLIRKISWALTGVYTASVSSDGTVLSITKYPGPDFAATDNPITIYASGGTILMQRGGATPVALNSAAFPVQVFAAHSEVLGVRTSISITFSIQGVPFVYRTYMR